MIRRITVWGALLSITGCTEPKDPWWDALETSGSCHEVDLLDGLDTQTGDELTQAFHCLNQSGNLAALAESVDALKKPTRDSKTGALHLSLGLNELLQADLNVFALAGKVLDWMEADAPLLQESLRVSVELIYAQPYSVLEGSPAPQSQTALDKGVLSPLLSGLRAGLIAALDEGLSGLQTFDAALNSKGALNLIYSLSALTESPNEGFRHRIDDLLMDFGAALVATESPENNRTSSGTDNSLRDLTTALILQKDAQGRSAVALAETPAASLFQDASTQARVRTALEGLQDRDALRTLPLQLRYLSDIPADGGSFGPNIDSALVSLLRLIHDANTPLKCAIDWGVGSFDVDLGNLSVALLEGISDLDPEVSTESIDVLGNILGLPLTETILGLIATLEVCPTLDAQFVSDLQSINRLNDAAAGDLLLVLVELLQAMGEDNGTKIPELVDLLSIPHAVQASIPLEEVLRDLGGSPFLETLAAFAAPSLQPEDYFDASGFPEGVGAFLFEDLWEVGASAFESSSSGQTPIEDALPLLEDFVSDPNTWSGLKHLGPLLADPRSDASQILEWLPTLLELDPKLELTRELSGIFFAAETADHFAQVLEIPELYNAVSSSSEESPGPLVFMAELQLSGTLEGLLGTLERTIGLLGLTTD